MRYHLGLALPLALCVGLASPAQANTLAFTCEERDAGKPATMTIAYEGEATGTLKIAGSFGEMSLPATKEETELEIEGQKVKQTGIRAFGEAKVLMPGKAALEACIAGKRAPDETDDILDLMACRGTVALALSAVTASVELVFHAGAPDPFVYLKRTYAEKSNDYLSGNGKTGGFISIESVPPPTCTPAAAP
jgi:hypothetical protein